MVVRNDSGPLCAYLGSGEAEDEVGCTGDVMAAAVVVEAVGDCMGGSTVIYTIRGHRIPSQILKGIYSKSWFWDMKN